MRLWVAGVAGWLLSIGAAAAQSPPFQISPALVDLSAGRTGEGSARTFPLTLRKAEVSGAALVECRVAANALADCVVLGENPKGGDVGSGAVKLLSYGKVAAQTHDGRPTADGYVVYPMIFHWPRKPHAETPFFPGEPAYVVTRTAFGEPTARIGCPTAADPAARCFLHPVNWGWPPLGVAAEAVRKVGKTTGESSLNCRFDDDRRLVDCKGSPDLTEADVAVLAEMLGGYRVRETTRDGVAVANTRMVAFFDWPQITRTLELSRLTRR